MSDSKNTKLIPLTQGKFAIVDEEYYKFLNQWKWHLSTQGYAKRNIRKRKENKFLTVLMHRLIINTPYYMQTDHINGNRLDNRKCNLRICTHAQNQYNQNIRKNGKSIYKGVSWQKPWVASIRIDSKKYNLGAFASEEEAAFAYNKAAIEYYGEFAKLNIIESPPQSSTPND
jgi:hypothetical protein